jgi:hypothetical protein
MFFELIEYLLDMKDRRKGLDHDCSSSGPGWNSESQLRVDKDFIPPACFQVVLQLG